MQEEIKLIGRRIRLLRTAKNLTQTGLAKEMGISQTHLCNIECGRVPVTLPNLLKLHSLLECNMSSFFVDLDEQADAKDKDISLEEVLQIVKLLKQKCNMSSFFVDLDEQADAKDKDISLEEVLQIVKLLKQKG